LFATAALGAIWVPIGPYLKGRFLAHQLEMSQPKVLITDAPGAVASKPHLTSVDELAHVLCLDEGDFGTALGEVCVDDELEPVNDGGLAAAVLFTSGTTGPAKGCVVSQGYFGKAGACYSWALRAGSDDVIYTAFPLFHGAGLAIAMMALCARATYRHPGSFSASQYMSAVAASKATVTIGTGSMAAAIMAQPPRSDDRDHSLRVAEWIPLTREVQQRFGERFAVRVYGEHYGQTECMITTQTPLSEARNPGSVGRESPLVQLAVVDDDDRPVAPGVVGEIVLRPRTPGAMFREYWRQPTETLAAWRDLWHHTGDFGVLDAEGVLNFVDRKSDSLRRRGENISSLEVETALLEHPDIADVAVYAVPSELSEDDLKACIVARPEVRLEPMALVEFFARVLPYFAIPRYVDVVDALPRTPNQKVRKAELRDRGNSASTWDFESLGLTLQRAARRG
jgi:crotonobetaine/carnitine-CoA ligase